VLTMKAPAAKLMKVLSFLSSWSSSEQPGTPSPSSGPHRSMAR
jgi:hypothetical protein